MDETLVTKKKGHYLYAIVSNGDSLELEVSGIAGEAVRFLSFGGIAAAVSPYPLKKIRPERKNLMAHNNVLKALLEVTTVLPMTFGTIIDNTEQIYKILDLNKDALGKQLSEIEGCVEMGLQVNWDVPNIFEYFIDIHPELKRARDQLMPPSQEPSRHAKIELGQLFDQTVNRDRRQHAETIEGVLQSVCSDIKRLEPPRDLKEVVRFALLVKRDKVDELENELVKAANLFDNSYSFDYNGPWALFNFASINLEIEATSDLST